MDADFLRSSGLPFEIPENYCAGTPVYRYCYYDFDSQTERYTSNPRWTYEVENIELSKTAIIVIDAWDDCPFEEINIATNDHVNKYLFPVLERAVDLGICIYIFTNNPDLIKYTTHINCKIEQLVHKGMAKLCYYDDYAETKSFLRELKKNGIKNLVYTGYATHLCLLYREVGILSIFYSMDKESEYRIFMIPEATMAYIGDDELNLRMRDDVCVMLSQQGVARMIRFKDFLEIG